MIVPPVEQRREIDRNLVVFFREHRSAAFRRAISDFCRFFNVRPPSIEWYEYIDWGKTIGKTFPNGQIHMVHPENWKRGRIYNSERMWVQAVYHEMGHYLFWSDAERKADAFTRRMVHGLRRAQRRTRISSRSRGAGARRTVSTITAVKRKAAVRTSMRARQRQKRKVIGGARKARRS
jgi:hypothetical protein